MATIRYMIEDVDQAITFYRISRLSAPAFRHGGESRGALGLTGRRKYPPLDYPTP